MAPRKNADTSNRPQRTSVSADGIPSRTTRTGSTYPEWSPEVDDLRNALGEAFEYAKTENAGTVAAALRRIYGITVRLRNFDSKTKVGDLWLSYPVLRDEDGNVVGPDEDAVAAIKAKYAKKDRA